MSRYILKGKNLVEEKYLKNQAKRLIYITKNIVINKLDVWCDIGWNDDKNIARKYLKKYYKNEPYILSDDLNFILSCKSEHFDVITHLEVIEHLLNPLLNIQECYRILKPGGKLYLTTPNDYSITLKLEHLLSRKLESHFHQFNEYELEYLFGLTDFKTVKIKKFKKSKKGIIARWCKNSFFIEATK